MLEAKQLSRSYGSFLAVDDVNFSAEKGEIVGLLGHNGAGKTTIMKMLSGSLEPDRGMISIGGVDMLIHPKLAQAKLGYLSENLPIYPELTVAEYLDYAGRLKGLTGESHYAEMRRVVQATDISEKIHAPINTLSRGFKQRLGVAQALLGKPQLLILDEPTNGLDPTQTAQMRELIREIAKEATVLLSTHIMQEVDAICDRVLILSAGRLVIDERLLDLQYSDELLLMCSFEPAEAKSKLRGQAGVSTLYQASGQATDTLHEGASYTYRISVKDKDRIYEMANHLAQAVVAGNGKLYRLQPVQRDLETLFSNVSGGNAS
ncbi:MAG: ABC transporter ATP-binding protein [Candidatus Eutrophobiaceae bacterium]